METNIITITNIVFQVSTNPVPVTISGLDYNTALSLYFSGMQAGAIPAASLWVVVWIWRVVNRHAFPFNQDKHD
jgi:hypothetical protein